MPYLFISHASEDKELIKPIVVALVMRGIKVWIDRPGHGESHFNFDQEFIDRYGIQGLKTGLNWNDQISDAIREAGAVLVCISKALCSNRQVLVQELLLGAQYEKLVACIVDDLPYSEIPKDLGLADPSKIQAERIDTSLLQKTLDRQKKSPAFEVEKLPVELKRQLEIINKLVNETNRIFEKSYPRLPTTAEIEETRKELEKFPIGPMVRIHEIPIEIINIFAEFYGEPEKAKNFIALAMNLRSQCNSENFTERQIIVRSGEVLNPHSVSAEEYWTDVLAAAGRKSRRTLAALMVAPGAPRAENFEAALSRILMNFQEWLEKPAT
jgi:hypothetical protein